MGSARRTPKRSAGTTRHRWGYRGGCSAPPPGYRFADVRAHVMEVLATHTGHRRFRTIPRPWRGMANQPGPLGREVAIICHRGPCLDHHHSVEKHRAGGNVVSRPEPPARTKHPPTDSGGVDAPGECQYVIHAAVACSHSENVPNGFIESPAYQVSHEDPVRSWYLNAPAMATPEDRQPGVPSERSR